MEALLPVRAADMSEDGRSERCLVSAAEIPKGRRDRSPSPSICTYKNATVPRTHRPLGNRDRLG
jgi:hypothetical protein